MELQSRSQLGTRTIATGHLICGQNAHFSSLAGRTCEYRGDSIVCVCVCRTFDLGLLQILFYYMYWHTFPLFSEHIFFHSACLTLLCDYSIQDYANIWLSLLKGIKQCNKSDNSPTT